MCHASAFMMMGYVLPPVMLDFSGERCASSVRGLSAMTRGELEAFLQATARASGAVVPARAPRPKPTKVGRAWRPSWS